MLARIWALLPLISLSLFVSRILAEQFSLHRLGISNSLTVQGIAAGVLMLLCTALAAYISPKSRISSNWPLLGLLLYTAAPTQDPRFLIASLLLTLLLFGLSQRVADRLDEGIWSGNGVMAFLLLVFAVGFGLTVSQDLLPADNGEFQLRAAQLGVAHPPGFPLYTLLAWLMTKLPGNGSPALMVNLLGLICALGTLIGVYKICYRLTHSTAAALLGSTFLGVATTFWAQATTANIRSLTALFVVLMFWTAVRWYQQTQTHEEDDRWPWLFTLFAVLGVGHHASLIFMGTVIFLFMVCASPRYWAELRRWLPRLGAIGLGLLPQLYLVWRGSAGAPGSPADLDTPLGIFNHITARGFQGDLFHFLSWPDFADRLAVMVDVIRFQWPLALIVAALLGWLLLWQRQRPIAVLLITSTMLHTLVTATYRAPQTVEYMLPAYVPWAIAFAALPGLWPPGYRFTPPSSWPRIVRPTLLGILSLLLIARFSQSFSIYRQIRLENDTRAYISAVLDNAPPNAIILADWHWATPLWYATEVEHQRPDVTVRYVFPTDEPYGETWARRVREELDRPVITTHFEAMPYASLPTAVKIGEAYLFGQQQTESLANELQVDLTNGLSLTGYAVLTDAAVPGETFTVLLTSSSPTGTPLPPTTLFVHLVADDGTLMAQQDVPLPGSPGPQTTAFALTPRLQTLPGAYQLFVGAYNSLDGAPIPSVTNQATRTPLAPITVAVQRIRPLTQNRTYRPDPENARTLIGYDWDTTFATDPRLYLHWQVDEGYITETPPVGATGYPLTTWAGPWGIPVTTELAVEQTNYVPFAGGMVWLGPLWQPANEARPGEQVHLAGRWGSSRPNYRDFGVAMRLVGYEAGGDRWAWSDLDNRFGIPGMGAIPTLKWVAGSRVYDTHRLTISPEGVPNQRIGVIVGLYNTMTNETVSVLDERLGAATPWYLTTIEGDTQP